MTERIREILEGQFPEVWIQGEISNFRPANSGHYYFSLKDESAQIRAVMFRGSNRELRFRLENGLSVLCYGRVSVYAPRGDYQIIVEQMEPKGVGALQLAFEQLKQKLEAEGLFDPKRKKKIPFLPEKIGIVTSPTGSVIRDMIQILTRRFPNVPILLNPVSVQGEGAASEIATAIREMNERNDIDLLIVGRGGGSMEDLWAFNEEVVARAIADSQIPIISAVGHETDFTIADFVADLRAPTPSAAAELAVPVKEDLLEEIRNLSSRLVQVMESQLENLGLQIGRWEVFFRDPERRLTEPLLQVDHLRDRLVSFVEHEMGVSEEGIKRLKGHLESLSPLSVLERGYAIATRRGDPHPLKGVTEVSVHDQVDVRLHRGVIRTRVVESIKH